MGAYENPREYIDTQTAQSYQHLQDTISGVAAGYAEHKEKKLEENKKRLETNQLEIDKGNLALYSELDKNTAANKSIDWHATYDPYVQEYANLNSSLLNGTAKDRAATLKRMSNLKSTISTSADTITSLMSGYENFDKGIKKIGLPGGVSSVGNDVNQVNAYNVLTGKTKGSVKVIIDPKTLAQSFIVNGEVNGKPFKPVTFDATQLNKAADGSGVINYNYDTFEQDNAMKIETGLFTSQKDRAGKDTGVPDIIKDEFYLPDAVSTKVGVTQKAGFISSKNVIKLDEAKATATLKPKIDIQADGLLANPLSAAGTYHDVFKGSDTGLTAESLLADPKKIEEFKKAYLDYVVRTLPKERPILDENGNVTITTVIDPNAPKKGRGTISKVGGPKATANQLNQKDFNADIEGKIAAGEGVVVGKGNTLTIENGIGIVTGKDGVEIARGNPMIMQGHVGGTVKPKLKGIKK